jgi:hypothetical protein
MKTLLALAVLLVLVFCVTPSSAAVLPCAPAACAPVAVLSQACAPVAVCVTCEQVCAVHPVRALLGHQPVRKVLKGVGRLVVVPLHLL